MSKSQVKKDYSKDVCHRKRKDGLYSAKFVNHGKRCVRVFQEVHNWLTTQLNGVFSHRGKGDRDG